MSKNYYRTFGLDSDLAFFGIRVISTEKPSSPNPEFRIALRLKTGLRSSTSQPSSSDVQSTMMMLDSWVRFRVWRSDKQSTIFVLFAIVVLSDLKSTWNVKMAKIKPAAFFKCYPMSFFSLCGHSRLAPGVKKVFCPFVTSWQDTQRVQ